jgi:predicted aspartyl protease
MTIQLLFCFDYITVTVMHVHSLSLLLLPLALLGQVVPIAVHGPLAVVSVQLNGQGPFRMIIDTGASSCSITPRVASLLNLSAEYRVLDSTPNGKRLTSGIRSVEVELGTRVAKNVAFLWQESRGLTVAGVEVDGVLGQSFLSRFDYLLDYKSGQLVLDSPERQSAGTPGKQIKFAHVAGRMLLTAMNPAEGSMRLILDSGASNVLLWRGGDSQARSMTASLMAMNGRRAVNLIRMPLLMVGDQMLQRLDVVVAPLPDEGREEDGLIPAGLFRSIYVSNSETYVKLRQ